MRPTHRAIITQAMLDKWFVRIADAHRNPNGAFYELKSGQISADYTLGRITISLAAFQDAVFLVSNASDLEPDDPETEDLYLTILDRAYWTQVDEVRWKIRLSDSYWHTGKLNPPVSKLHQRVFEIANGRKANHDIHHRNFFTFDNRAKNLEDITTADHAAIHASVPKLDGYCVIDNDMRLLDLVASVL